MLRLYVVGCGGIGGYVTDLLPMCITSIGLDFLARCGRDITPYLTDAGNCVLPSIVESLTLIDGDTFDARNAIRQGAGAGNKLAQRLYAINNSMVRQTYLRNVTIGGFATYVTPDNVELQIPKEHVRNEENSKAFENMPDNYKVTRDRFFTTDIPIIFICVDNVKTRYELSKYAERFDNVLVINGGNEKTTGQITVYERRDGNALDPNIDELFTNIRPDVDKRPDELSCTHVAPKHDQIAIVNAMVANVMMELFTHWAASETLSDFVVRGKPCRRNEVFIDIEKLSMIPVTHQKTQSNTNEGGQST